MGGQCLCFSNIVKSSLAKGESFSDTVKTMSMYSDFIVIRHKCDGAARAASIVAKCPVINAGDGVHLHPTQTLIDLFTIKELKNTLEGLVVGFCGDLKFSRPVNSLVLELCKKFCNKFIFISTNEQKISNYLSDFLKKFDIEFLENTSLEAVISKLDVLYMTRVQKERFQDVADYEKQKSRFILNNKILNSAKSDLSILHPLPRVDEISVEVDCDPRAAYFLQILNGVFVRMALISKILSSFENYNIVKLSKKIKIEKVCSNANCISHFDSTLPRLFNSVFGDGLFCFYCDKKVSV